MPAHARALTLAIAAAVAASACATTTPAPADEEPAPMATASADPYLWLEDVAGERQPVVQRRVGKVAGQHQWGVDVGHDCSLRGPNRCVLSPC